MKLKLVSSAPGILTKMWVEMCSIVQNIRAEQKQIARKYIFQFYETRLSTTCQETWNTDAYLSDFYLA